MLKTNQQTRQDNAGSCFIDSVEFEAIQFNAKTSPGDIVSNVFATSPSINVSEHFSLHTTSKAVQLPIIVSQIMSSTELDTDLGNSSCAQDAMLPEAGPKLNNCFQTQSAEACDKETDCAVSDNVLETCQSVHSKSTVSSKENHVDCITDAKTDVDVKFQSTRQLDKSALTESVRNSDAVLSSNLDDANTHTNLKLTMETAQLGESGFVKEPSVSSNGSSTDTIHKPPADTNSPDLLTNVDLKTDVKRLAAEKNSSISCDDLVEQKVEAYNQAKDSTSGLNKMLVLTTSQGNIEASVPLNNSEVTKKLDPALSLSLDLVKSSTLRKPLVDSETVVQEEEETKLSEDSVAEPEPKLNISSVLSEAAMPIKQLSLNPKEDPILVKRNASHEIKTVTNSPDENEKPVDNTEMLVQSAGIEKESSTEDSAALKTEPTKQTIPADMQSNEPNIADGSNPEVRQLEYGYSQDKVCADVSVSENQNNENSVKSAERLKEKTECKEKQGNSDAGSDNEVLQNTNTTMMEIDEANNNESTIRIVDVTCQNKPSSDSLGRSAEVNILETTNLMTPESVKNGTESLETTTDEHREKMDCSVASTPEDTSTTIAQCDTAASNSEPTAKTILASAVKENAEINSVTCEDTDDEQMKLAGALLKKNGVSEEGPGENIVVSDVGEGTVDNTKLEDLGVASTQCMLSTTDEKSTKSEMDNDDSVASDKANNNDVLKREQKCKQAKGEVSENACNQSLPNGNENSGLADTSDNAKTRAFWDLGLIPSGMNKSTKEQIFLNKENGNDTTLASNTSTKTDLLVDTPRVRKAPRPFDEVYGETESTRKGVKRKRPSHPNRGPVNVSEKCLEAFELGWMRELVYRATLDEGKARTADVYYYSPSKVKLRSYREIEDFLKSSKSSLTIENFSFAKSAIYHPPEEIVREAKRTGVRQSLGPKSPVSTPPLKLKLKTKKKLKRKLVKESQSESDSPKKKVPRTYELINLPPDGTNSPFRLRLKKNIKRTPFRGRVEVVPCSLNCPGQKGVLPSLHCGVCLCLYHPACVGFENNLKAFVCVKCISDRTQRNHGGQQHSKENEPTKDDYSSGDAPLSLQVKAELILDDDSSSSPTKDARPHPQDVTSAITSPSTPVRGLPKLIQMPPTCTTSSPVINTNVVRPPPPLQKAPGVSLINKAAGSTWMPPSGLPPQTKQLAPQPPPLRLANALPNMQPMFITKNIPPALPNRPPPPLMIRPMTSLANTEHVPASILSMFAVRPQTTVTVTSDSRAPLRLPNPVITGGGVTIVRPTQLVQIPAPVSTQQTPTSVAVPAGLLQQILTTVSQTAASTINTVTTTAARTPSILTVSKVTTPSVVLPPSIPANPKAVLVTMMSNQNSVATAAPSTANVNSMKFTLKTNSGTTTEVLVPQVKPPIGAGPLQPKYIVVNKQGQPTGLVVGVGNTVIQLPILNQSISVTDPSKFLKDASTAAVKHPGVQETVSTVTATGSSVVAPKPVMHSGGVASTSIPVIKINNPQPRPLQPKQVIQGPVVGASQTSATSKVSVYPLIPVMASASAASAPPPVELSIINSQAVNSDNNADVAKEQKTLEAVPQTQSERSGTRVHKVAKQRRPGANPSLCAMEKLMGGTKALLKIFKYLRQDDLSRASSVCRTWRWLASQTEKWKCIKLNGIQVCDWDRLVDIIKRHESTRLDMRGMKTFEDKNRTWHGFAAALQDLSCIRRIDFGQVPVSILHTVANSLMELEVLTAEWITDIGKEADCANSNCRLDVGKFGQLVQLQKLRLRGVRGIQLPTFTLSRGLTSLSSLNKLTHLSLTTLKDVPPNEFEFLTSLTQLLALEIGDCTLWQNEHYDHLTNLNNLKRLRLECSSPDTRKGLNEALLKLKQLQHVELFNISVDELLLDALKELRLLAVLSLWPNESQEGATVNTAIFVGVGQLLQLQQFSWGLATENYKLTPTKTAETPKDLGDDDDDIIEIGSDDECGSVETDHGLQDNEECIPFLLTEVSSEDSAYLREYLSFRELDHRLRRKLTKTKISLHPLNSPIIHSRIRATK